MTFDVPNNFPPVKHPDTSDIRESLRVTGFPSEPLSRVLEYDIAKVQYNLVEKQTKNMLDLIEHLGITQEEFFEKYFLEELTPELQLIQSEPFNDTYQYKVVSQFRFRAKSMRPDLFPVKENNVT